MLPKSYCKVPLRSKKQKQENSWTRGRVGSEYSRLSSPLAPRLATITSVCGMQVHSMFNGLIFKLSKISLILAEQVTGKSGLIANFVSWKRSYYLAFLCGNKDLVVSLKVQHAEKLVEFVNEPT